MRLFPQWDIYACIAKIIRFDWFIDQPSLFSLVYFDHQSPPHKQLILLIFFTRQLFKRTSNSDRYFMIRLFLYRPFLTIRSEYNVSNVRASLITFTVQFLPPIYCLLFTDQNWWFALLRFCFHYPMCCQFFCLSVRLSLALKVFFYL